MFDKTEFLSPFSRVTRYLFKFPTLLGLSAGKFSLERENAHGSENTMT